jgi:hypothetical protein
VISVTNVLDIDSSEITTQAADAGGGNIVINGQQIVVRPDQHLVAVKAGAPTAFLISLRDGSITTSVAHGEGNGGDILIDPRFLVLQEGSSIKANAVDGKGGNVLIVAGTIFAGGDLKQMVSASSQRGVQGVVAINAANTDLVKSIEALPANFVDPSHLLREQCAARQSARGAGSFVVQFRAGAPPSPEGLLSAPALGIPIPLAGRGFHPEHLGAADLFATNCPIP